MYSLKSVTFVILWLFVFCLFCHFVSFVLCHLSYFATFNFCPLSPLSCAFNVTFSSIHLRHFVILSLLCFVAFVFRRFRQFSLLSLLSLCYFDIRHVNTLKHFSFCLCWSLSLWLFCHVHSFFPLTLLPFVTFIISSLMSTVVVVLYHFCPLSILSLLSLFWSCHVALSYLKPTIGM